MKEIIDMASGPTKVPGAAYRRSLIPGTIVWSLRSEHAEDRDDVIVSLGLESSVDWNEGLLAQLPKIATVITHPPLWRRPRPKFFRIVLSGERELLNEINVVDMPTRIVAPGQWHAPLLSKDDIQRLLAEGDPLSIPKESIARIEAWINRKEGDLLEDVREMMSLLWRKKGGNTSFRHPRQAIVGGGWKGLVTTNRQRWGRL